MESDHTENEASRPNKHVANHGANLNFLTPKVNSCKLHFTDAKSPVPERTQTMTDYEGHLQKPSMTIKKETSRFKSSVSPTQNVRHMWSRREELEDCAELAKQGVAVLTQEGQNFHEIRGKPIKSINHIELKTESQDANNPNKDPVYSITRLPVESSKLDLDRRSLKEFPQLDLVGDVQFLNLQRNLITKIQRLSHLQHLILLNLYDNQISDMSGIEALQSLRILLLGRNRIKKICSLENLCRLNILDLQNNEIRRIENISHLNKLQVLNLSGNNISEMENLQGLNSLTELNLQHNSISTVTEVDCLPCLQRLFLSSNNISSLSQLKFQLVAELKDFFSLVWRIDQLTCIGSSRSLSELTLDGNPVALETWYKQAVLRCVLHLKQLDMKRITEEDRRVAGVHARKEEEKKEKSQKQTVHKEKRRLAIRNAAQQWEGVRACLELPPTTGSKEEVSPENSPGHNSTQTNGLTHDPSPEEPRRVSPGSGPERPSSGAEIRLKTNSRPNSPRDAKLIESLSGSVQSLSLSDSHLAELEGDTLRLFGLGALEALERGWGVQTAGAVTVITFRYINFDAIVPSLPRIRVKFPNLSHLIFLETNISRLPQLAALALVRRLDQLTIHQEGNPVVGLALWRSFVIYRLHHFNLQKINGEEVTMEDMMAAERAFGILGHVAATETPRCRLLLLLEESRKRQLQFLLEGRGRRAGLSPDELRENGKLLGESLSRALFNYPSRDCNAESPEEGSAEASQRAAMIDQYLRDLVQRASDTNLKAEALHKVWPSMFAEMVRDCVVEMRDRAAFRHASLAKLSQTK